MWLMMMVGGGLVRDIWGKGGMIDVGMGEGRDSYMGEDEEEGMKEEKVGLWVWVEKFEGKMEDGRKGVGEYC